MVAYFHKCLHDRFLVEVRFESARCSQGYLLSMFVLAKKKMCSDARKDHSIPLFFLIKKIALSYSCHYDTYDLQSKETAEMCCVTIAFRWFYYDILIQIICHRITIQTL